MPRVLLADDSPHAQRMGLEILTQRGFEVLSVTDGRDVGAYLERFQPDLVLADVSMPGQSGYQICEQIKTNPDMRSTPVILLVGASDEFDPGEARRVSSDGVLRKPFEPSAVMEAVDALLAGKAPSPHTVSEDFAQVVEQAVQAGPQLDPERVRAAVVLAVESAVPGFVDEVTRRVMETLRRG